MGNYYEGSISLYLKKDTPREVLKTLLSVPVDVNAYMNYIADEFKGIKIFERGKYKPDIYIDMELIDKDGEPAYTDYMNIHSISLYELNEAKNNGYQVQAFTLTMNFFIKTSWDEFYSTVAQDWFNFVKDYIDTEYTEKQTKIVPDGLLKLGEIHDEDGYYNLVFILNKDKEPEILDFSLQPNVSNKVSEYNMQEEQE